MLYRPKGCEACGGTGFRGRLSVMELLSPVDNDEIALAWMLVRARKRVKSNALPSVAHGMRTMLVDGIRKSQQGLTTIEEVLRATREV